MNRPRNLASRPLPSITAVTGTSVSADSDVVVVPVDRDAPSPVELDLPAAAQQLSLPERAGSTFTLPLAALHAGQPLLHVVRYGDGSAGQARLAGAAIGSRTRRAAKVQIHGADRFSDDALAAFVQGLLLAWWTPDKQGLTAKPPAHTRFELSDVSAQVVERASRLAQATATVRDLAVTPSNLKTPAWLADQATALAREHDLTATVLDEKDLRAQGFGGLLAVGAGSDSPPRLVSLTYDPGRKRAQHVVLVGKGITFDTGGISIKPREAMVSMKTDMAGAAVALATVVGAARAGVHTKVTAVLALAENHFGGNSYRPGDVVTVFGGTTVEIANTDAEGRMVLADAMAYAVSSLNPDLLIDIATLTGAASLGLGRGHGALYATDQDVADALSTAGTRAGEPVWQLPLEPDYLPAIESDVADTRHVPDHSPGAGSITAALFLQQFAGGVPWVHLDIAGPARAEKPLPDCPKGATGFGARLLLDYLSA